MSSLLDGHLPHASLTLSSGTGGRESNQILDFFPKFTMEMENGESWLKEIAPRVPNVSLCEAIIFCHYDGGTWKDSCSVAVWIVETSVGR